MKTWTYAEAREKIENDLDLQEELFVTASEMLGYFNDAIDEAETIVHNLYEDYFLTTDTLNLVEGIGRYAMPQDIYANKIRMVVITDGICQRPIRRGKLKEIVNANYACDYFYDIQHRSALEGVSFNIFPLPKYSGAVIDRYYIRNANRLTDSDSLIDIPEGMGFIFAHVKASCMTKETHPMMQKAMADLEAQRGILANTLQAMVPDGDNFISPDLQFYYDHV